MFEDVPQEWVLLGMVVQRELSCPGLRLNPFDQDPL